LSKFFKRESLSRNTGQAFSRFDREHAMDVHEDTKEIEAAKERVGAMRDAGRRDIIVIAGFFIAVLLFVLSRYL
jgi:hypothetical protein